MKNVVKSLVIIITFARIRKKSFKTKYNFSSNIVFSVQSTEAGTFGGPGVVGSPIIPRLTSYYDVNLFDLIPPFSV